MKCVKQFKDKKTGECYQIKDEIARSGVAELSANFTSAVPILNKVAQTSVTRIILTSESGIIEDKFDGDDDGYAYEFIYNNDIYRYHTAVSDELGDFYTYVNIHNNNGAVEVRELKIDRIYYYDESAGLYGFPYTITTLSAGSTGPVIKTETMTATTLFNRIDNGEITPLSILTIDWVPDVCKYEDNSYEEEYARYFIQWTLSMVSTLQASGSQVMRDNLRSTVSHKNSGTNYISEINISANKSSFHYYMPTIRYDTIPFGNNISETVTKTGGSIPQSFLVTYIENGV